ncbi:UNVERIFIED_CONTAM: hypothetical protein FKN15_038437 [Acipenser sinensis]
MAGLELLYNSVIDNIASPQDALLCFVHWEIIRNGFKCLGTGDQPGTNDKRSELLPAHWNESSELYTLRYESSDGKVQLLVKAITVDSSVIFNVMWLLPVLLIPKPLNPALWFNHSMFMGFYLLSFLLERKPCTICALVFLAALFLICYSCWGNCFLYHCSDSPLPDSAHDPSIVGT